MRLLITFLAAGALGCGVPKGPDDAGTADAGMTATDSGSTAPCASGGQSCVEVVLSDFAADCAPTSEEARFRFCPPGYSLTRQLCAGGVTWTSLQNGLGPTTTCVYATDGGLIGAAQATDYGSERHAGTWELTGCQVAAEACEDAGACAPLRPNGVCRSRYDFRGSCSATSAEQRARVCNTDAGRWVASSCSDGGTLWIEPVGEFGARSSCAYVEGALSGATISTDAGVDWYAGSWLLQGCVQSAACP